MKKPDPANQDNRTSSILYKAAMIVRRLVIPGFVITVHLVLIFTITISIKETQKQTDTTIFKMVDVEEFIPPPEPEPEKEEKKEIKKEDVVEVSTQPDIAETIIETDKEVIETEKAPNPAEIDYLPQHRISVAPDLPDEEILSQVIYPVLAKKQKIQGVVVYLELYIDKNGIIRNIKILKDPGYGFGQAAVDALDGIECTPAKANEVPVAVKYRYAVRFTLK